MKIATIRAAMMNFSLNKTLFLGLKPFKILFLFELYNFAYILGIVTFCPENTDSSPLNGDLSTKLSTGSGER
ncbi:MAG: hypothetical protein EBU10_03040 [Alphaproteobacteria bacterium]|nr:hypothetical protein [Alphaproteobacteria bacterium]